jgi:valyl-tRNA synthetase
MQQDALPPAYDPKAVGKKWYDKWEQAGYFHADAEPGKPRYCITIPPPNVTGSLHMGHALQHAIHDALVRFRRMQGLNTLCLPGMDHAGIATQMVVEKELARQGITRQQLGREAFVERVWEWKRQYGGEILRQLRALGCSYDWRREVFTLDESYSKAVLTAFVCLHEKGMVYRGQRVINWCPRCLTAVSDLEVRPREHEGHLWYIHYPLVDGSGRVTVATTRPETMLGDQAVAVHPDDERYKALVGKSVYLPLTGYARTDGAIGREIPIIQSERVDPHFAYGALKITPVHDAVDFEILEVHGMGIGGVAPLEPYHRASEEQMEALYPWGRVIGKDGRMTQNAGPYEGMDRFEAREKIVQDLQEGGYLEKIEPYTHPLPHCDRCNTVIEPLLSEQWFVSMKVLAEPAITVIKEGRVKYVPDRFARLTIEWLENIRDWCISRQLWWGHRIPAWKCRKCTEWTVSLQPPAKCCKEWCGGTELEQDPDVLDTWFSSALWPFAVLGWPEQTADLNYFYPTDILITDRMILYLWVARMIFCGLEFRPRHRDDANDPDDKHRDEDLPFREVLVHPTVMTSEGKRMSRTLGTGVDPMELLEKYGADAVRFGLLATCGTDQDVRFSEEKIQAARAFCTKIWNAARLVLSNLGDSEQAYREPPRPDESHSLAERWILSRLDAAVADVAAALDGYRFDEAARRLHEFFWAEFCDWYLEMAKPAFRSTGAEAQRARHVAVWVLRNALQLMHPFMPFISEELWHALPHDGQSIMISQWPVPLAISDERAEGDFSVLRIFTTAARRHKQSRGLAADAPAEMLIATRSARLRQVVEDNLDAWKTLPGIKAQSAVVQQDEPDGEWGPRGGIAWRDMALGGAEETAERLEGPSVGIKWGDLAGVRWEDLGGSIYIRGVVSAAEMHARRQRLERERADIEAELARLRARLSSAQFLEKAPADVAEKTRRREQELAARLAALQKEM